MTFDEFTDAHVAVIGVLRFDPAATPEDAATILGLPVERVLTLLADLERVGLIRKPMEH